MKVTRRTFHRLALGSATGSLLPIATRCLLAQDPSPIPFQPFAAKIERLLSALENLGTPLSFDDRRRVREALQLPAGEREGGRVNLIQNLLAPHVLMEVELNPEMRIVVRRGPAPAELYQGGWRTFLVKVWNYAGTTPLLTIKSPQEAPWAEDHRSLSPACMTSRTGRSTR